MRGPRVFALFVSACVIITISAGCAKTPGGSVLQAQDTASIDGQSPFDPTEIIDLGSFTDTQSFAAIDVQTFLEHTPYARSSFLSTYQSNGVRAVDAVMSSALKYGINPLVFLTRAEVDQGLIGAQYYPFPTSRVEYVFGCGCTGSNDCDPALAGFDRQVDCLARKLSTSLGEITAGGSTAGGWGPGNASLTLDGHSVTPQDASTAALYQYNPVVGTGSSGNWLMWNIWQFYTNFLTYGGPVGGPTTSGGWIGDPCAVDASCAVPGGFCATNFPAGLCTVACTDGCPTADGRPDSFCADFGSGSDGGAGGGYCLPVCNPGTAGTCRAGYDCKSILVFGSSTSENGCTQSQ